MFLFLFSRNCFVTILKLSQHNFNGMIRGHKHRGTAGTVYNYTNKTYMSIKVSYLRRKLRSFLGLFYNVENLITVIVCNIINIKLNLCSFFYANPCTNLPTNVKCMVDDPVMWVLDVFGRLLRETVLNIACQMGNKEDLDQASLIFDQWIDGSLRYHQSSGLFVVNFP